MKEQYKSRTCVWVNHSTKIKLNRHKSSNKSYDRLLNEALDCWENTRIRP